MICSFKHKGLEKLFSEDSTKGVEQIYVEKIKRILFKLNTAHTPEDMNLPGYKLHALTGNRQGYWAVTVSANWRIVFMFDGENVENVNLVDYH